MQVNLEYYSGGVETVLYSAGYLIAPPVGAADKIRSFEHLPLGWDYGEGGPIPSRTIRKALAWNNRLYQLGFPKTNASAGSGGQIAVAAGRHDHYVEIIVEPDDTISIAYDLRRKQVLYRLHMQDVEADKLIIEIMEEIWSASTSFTQLNTIEMKIGGTDTHSN